MPRDSIGQERCRRLDDGIDVRADEASVPRIDALGPLAAVAQHQHRRAEARRLFLDATGVRQDQPRSPHQPDEGPIVDRRPQLKVGRGTDLFHGGGDVGIGVADMDEPHARERLAEAPDRLDDSRQWRTEVLAPVGRNQHERLSADWTIAPRHVMEGIDNRVACHEDL